jgi:DNA-binding protein HU-beta
MNKTELIDKLASDLGVTKVQAGAFVDAYHKTIMEELAADNSVTIIGFGTFSLRHRPARTGRNPRTGEPMELAASRLPTFKAGKTFKDSVAL